MRLVSKCMGWHMFICVYMGISLCKSLTPLPCKQSLGLFELHLTDFELI